MFLNELPPPFNIFTHEHAEHVASASPASSRVMPQKDAASGSSVVCQSSSLFISPRPLNRLTSSPACRSGRPPAGAGHACDVIAFPLLDQSVLRRQFFAAHRFFLREEIILDQQAVLLDPDESFSSSFTSCSSWFF